MDLGRAIGYPMKDQNWLVKGLIGAVISFIPFVNFISYGYLLRAMRNIANGDEINLPEWDDFGGDFMRGLMAAIGSFIIYLPILIVYCCLSMMGAVVGGEDGNALSGLLQCCAGILLFGYMLITAPMVAAAYFRFAMTNDFSKSFLDFGGLFREVTSHSGETMMFLILGFVMYVGAAFLTGITFWICGLGIFLGWLATLAGGHLVTQYGMAISDDLGKPKNIY